jgi:hypothetical protein
MTTEQSYLLAGEPQPTDTGRRWRECISTVLQ